MTSPLKSLLAAIIISLTVMMPSFAQELPKILVFSKTADFRHDNIEIGAEAIQKLGRENGFDVAHSEDAHLFTKERLAKYQAILFLSTTGNIFNDDQKLAFQDYIQNGGGFVGIHAASDTEHHWPWYERLIGGYFMSHPEVQLADIHVHNHEHPATAHLPKIWKRKDEWYDFDKLNPDVKLLMTLDENSYQGGKMGNFHPISWFHEYDGGRVFYTALGHTKEAFQEEDFLQHILGGIRYALGLKKD